MSKVEGGKVFVEIGADPRKLFAALNKANKALAGMGKSISAAGGKMLGMGAGVAAPILASAKAFADVGSALNDMSKRTGVAAESLSVLKFAAEQTGTDMAGVETAVKKMQKAIFSASNGGKEASEALDMVGLSAKDLAGLTADQQMGKIADGLIGIRDPGDRAAVAMKIFGKAGTDILPMLEGGSAGMAQFASEAKRLGLVMDTETAEKADTLGDAIDALTASAQMAFVQIGSAVAPALTSIAQGLAASAASVGQFIRENEAIVVVALKAAAALAAAGLGAIAIGKAMTFASSAIGGVLTVAKAAAAIFAAIVSPVGLIVAGIAAMGGAALYFSGALGGLVSIATTTFGGIYDAMAAGDLAGAMEIAMAGIKAIWLRGIESMLVAWYRGVGKIQKAFVQIGSAWDKYVTKPVSMLGIRVAEAAQERDVLGKFDTGLRGTIFDTDEKKQIRGRRKVAEDLLASGTAEDFTKNKAAAQAMIADRQRVVDAGRAPGASPEEQQAAAEAAKEIEGFRDAISMVRARMAQLGIKTDEQRSADNATRMGEIDAATQEAIAGVKAGTVQAAQDLADTIRGRREVTARGQQAEDLGTSIGGATSIDQLRGMADEFHTLKSMGRLTSEQESKLATALDDATERIMGEGATIDPSKKAQRGAAAVATQAEVAGTFSSSLGGMGFGSSLVQKIADYGKRTAEATEEMARGGAEVAA